MAATPEKQQRMQALRAVLEKEEAAGRLGAGMTVDDLMEAMAHPKAESAVKALNALEPLSVQQGQRAPDFDLPWLPGSAKPGVDSLSLSSHFGKRPVALIFGSYT